VRSQPWRLHPVPKAPFSETENGRARVNDAKCLQDSRFRALALNRLGAGNLLTTGVPEFTCLEFGSPRDTQERIRD
jgi:hypothetical protein